MNLSLFNTIPLRVSPVFWLLAFLIGYTGSGEISKSFIWVAVIFVSVLLHELGHALTATFFGLKTNIELGALGGLTQRRGPKLGFWKEFLIVLNGPLMGFALALVSYYAAVSMEGRLPFSVAYPLWVCYLINMTWTLLNLVPIVPLDGGRLLQITLEAIFGLRGLKASLFLSMLLAVAVGIYALVALTMFFAVIAFFFAYENYRTFRDMLSVTPQDQDENLLGLFKLGMYQVSLHKEEDAIQTFSQLREEAQKGVLYVGASEQLANLYARQERNAEAIGLLEPVVKQLPVESRMLLQRLYYTTADFAKAARLGTEIYNNQPDYQVALLNAFSFARLKEITPAIGWIQCLLRQSVEHPSDILKSPEFDPIRSEKAFQALLLK